MRYNYKQKKNFVIGNKRPALIMLMNASTKIINNNYSIVNTVYVIYYILYYYFYLER